MDNLEVCSIQGPRLPKNDPVHPLIGHRVRVTRGHFKGYDALVKYVGYDSVMIEIEGHLVSGRGRQEVEWEDLMAVYVYFTLLATETF